MLASLACHTESDAGAAVSARWGTFSRSEFRGYAAVAVSMGQRAEKMLDEYLGTLVYARRR
ncbi:MAG: hypothetical protein ACRDSE_09020 [Pseudonocardiaceae bacterium]